MKNKKGKSKSLIIESLIIIAIGVGMVFLNIYTQNLFTKLHTAAQSAVFVKDDVVFENEEEFAEQLVEYLPSSYKMIELYDENIDLLFQIQFEDGYKNIDDINTRPQIIEILKSNKQGQANMIIDGSEQSVYFEWIDNYRGEHRLLIVYSSIDAVEGIWMFHLVSYLIIILVFTLLMVIKIRHHKERINSYNDLIQHEEDTLR